MKRLLSLLLFIPALALAQNNPYALYEYIYAQIDTTQYEKVNLDSIDQLIFKPGKARETIDRKSDWSFQFGYANYWEEVVGGPTTGESPFPLLKTGRKYGPQPILSGQAIIDSCGDYLAPLSGVKSTYEAEWPYFTIARDDPRNRRWIPVQVDDWLVMRYVHSYPNGNMTSFYLELRLYFKRVDN